MIRTLAPFALAACLAACLTVAEPVPVGDGVYTLENGTPGSGAGIHDENYQRAIRFCFEQGKQLVRLDGSGAAAGQRPQGSGELRFRCVGPGETGWKDPVG